MKSGEIIAASAVMLILLGIAFALGGKGTYVNYLFTGNTGNQQSAQQSLPPATGTSIVGSPSLTAAKIDSILCGAGSPACGNGSAFYNDSVQYGIDDAYALAFFHHESGFGTAGAATQTLNMGNIVCTEGYNCIGRFRAYGSWAEGINDWYQLIKNVYVGQGRSTVESIIPMYAPSSDNNDCSAYISAVEADVQSWRS